MDKNKFLIDLSESEHTDFGKVDFAKQSDEQKVFSAIWTLESEVNNGGFAQYFENDRGETAHFAVAALQRVGAHKCARIVDRAVRAVCGTSLPANPKKWEAVAANLADETREKLEELDSDFYKYPDDLTELLFEFVQKHPKGFGIVARE